MLLSLEGGAREDEGRLLRAASRVATDLALGLQILVFKEEAWSKALLAARDC